MSLSRERAENPLLPTNVVAFAPVEVVNATTFGARGSGVDPRRWRRVAAVRGPAAPSFCEDSRALSTQRSSQNELGRAVVLVSGAPGAGKSSLAGPLATALGFPLLSKDVVKERLFDELGWVGYDRLAWSRRLGAAAMELLWALGASCPQVVLEANFRRRSDHERERIRALSTRPVEVWCSCPPEVAMGRYAGRAGRHEVHVLPALDAGLIAEFDGPVALGPVFEVDTTGAIDVAEVARRVRGELGR
jgi:predicted kinase